MTVLKISELPPKTQNAIKLSSTNLVYTAWKGKMLHSNDSPQASDGEVTTTTSLQPMGFTDILDTMFSLYRNHFRLFLGISAVHFFSHIANSTFAHWASLFCDMVVESLCYGWLAYASAQVYLGKHITAHVAFRQVKLRFWNLFGSSLFYWLVAVLMGITIIGVPFAIYFLTRWGFYVQAVMVEETSATNAMRRSSALVKGAWWRVFGVMFALLLLYLMIDLILITSSTLIFALSGIAGEIELLEMIRQTIWGPHGYIEGILHLLHAIQTAIDALTMPITAIGYTLLYYDLRIRKEGFDIEMMLAKEEV